EMVRVSFIMAKKGINGYSEENLHENNWWYDRVVEYNSFYPQYTGDKTTSFLGLSLPVGNNLEVIGQSPYISPYNYLWPIDDGLISANTLGRINQNLGYDGAGNNEPPKDQIEETSYE